MRKSWRGVLLFFVAIGVVFSLLTLFTLHPSVPIRVEGGVADLTGVDFSREVAAVQPEEFEFYPEVLLSPGDFEGRLVPRRFTSSDKWNCQYGTFRATLRLPAGQACALRSMSVNFSQRMWIDGVEQAPVGRPADSARETVPAARESVFLFTPRTDTVEVVLQYANFVYRGGGEAYPLFVSSYEAISRMELLSLFQACIKTGCMLTIFIFYLGLFLLLQRRAYLLLFAVTCLAQSVHALLVGEKFMTRLWPELGWYASMRVEYFALILMISSLVAYLQDLFPGLLHRLGFRLYLGFSAAFALAVALTPPAFFSWGLLVYQAVSVPYGLYILFRLVRYLWRRRDPEAALILVGGGIYVLGIIVESFLHIRIGHLSVSELNQPAMMVFIFFNMIALAVRFSRTERELAEMSELNRLKTEFLNQAGHDLKTPVASMGLSLQRLRHVEDEGARARFLSAAERSHRDMARQVGNLLNAARLDATGLRYVLTWLSPDDLCAAIQDKYEDQLEAAGVLLSVSADTRAHLQADKNLLWSVLDNLIYNALRYTPPGGSIQVSVGDAGGSAALTVSDTGPGIPEEALPHLFERGFAAGDRGGTGLGLYIVRTLVEGMGGHVDARNRPEGGAEFTITLPARREVPQ